MDKEITITLTWAEQQALWSAIVSREIEDKNWMKRCERGKTELESKIFDLSVTELRNLKAIKDKIISA